MTDGPWADYGSTPAQPASAPGPWSAFVTAPEPTEVDRQVAHGVKKNWVPADAKVASDPLSYLAAGWDMSVASLAQHAPKTVMPEHAGFMGSLLGGLGQTAGDIPTTVMGFIAGAPAGAKAGALAGALVPGAGETGASEAAGAALGGTVTGFMAGAALSQATRETLMSAYTKGSLTSWQDFAQRSSQIAYNSAQAGLVAGAGALVGGAAGGKVLSLTASSSAAAVANAATFAATATGVQAALDHKVPDAESFAGAVVMMLGLHAAGEIAGVGGRLVMGTDAEQAAAGARSTYAETGVPPWEAARRAQEDPGILHETVSRDVNDAINPRTLNEDRPPEPPPFRDGALQVEVPGEAGPSVDLHLAAIRALENSDAAAKLQSRNGAAVTADTVVSPKGAIGRYQIMPATARQYMGHNFDVNTLTDPKVNEKVAGVILKDLTQRYRLPDGSVDNEAVYIAYNAGPGRADRFIANGRDPSILPVETQKYLERADRQGLVRLTEAEFTSGSGQELVPAAQAGAGRGGEPPEEPPSEEELGPLRTPKPAEQMSNDELSESLRGLIDTPDRESFLSRAKGIADTAYDDIISELGPAKRWDEAMGLSTSKEVNMEDLFRSTYASPERAGYFIREGVIDNPYTFKEGSKDNLLAAYKMANDAGGTEQDFVSYRLGKRALDLEARGIKSGYTPEELEQARVFTERQRATYEAADQMANRSKQAVLRYAQKAGLYSEAQVDAMVEQNPSHIPFKRSAESEALSVRGPGKGMQSRQSIKKMEGSKRKIVEPVHAEIEDIHRTVQNADRNVALQALVGLDKRILEGLGIRKSAEQPIVPEIPTTLPATTGGGTALKEWEPGGAHTVEGTMKVRDQLLSGHKQGAAQFTVFVNGRPEAYETDDPAWARLINGSPKIAADAITKTMKFVAGLERTGITALPDYLARMLFRLQVSTSVLEPMGGVPGMNMLVGVMHALGQTGKWQEFVRSGGMGAGLMDMDVRYIRRDVERLFTQTNVISQVLNHVQHPIEASRLLMERGEAMGRLGAFVRAQEAGRSNLKAGMTARRAYLDFHERQASALVNWWSEVTPFMRLGLLGKDQIARQMKQDPLGLVGRGLLYVALPTVGLAYLRSKLDEDKPAGHRWKDQPQWIQDHYWGIPMPGGMPHLKLPKAYEVGMVFATQVENYMNYLETHDAKAFQALGENVMEMVAPNILPPGVRPILENITNFSFGNGRSLVPPSVQERSNYMQYTRNTSPTAVAIARVLGPPGVNLLNVSPIVLQNYVAGWMGTGGNTILHQLDAPQKPWAPRELADNFLVGSFFARTGGSLKPVDDFYDDLAELKRAHADFEAAVKDQNEGEIAFTSKNAEAFVNLDNMSKALGKMETSLNGIKDDKSMSIDEKRQFADQIIPGMVQLSEAGSKIVAAVKAGNEPEQPRTPGQEPGMPSVAAPAPQAAVQPQRATPPPSDSGRGPNGTLALPGGQ